MSSFLRNRRQTQKGCVEEEGGRAGWMELEKREGWHQEGRSSLWDWPGGGGSVGRRRGEEKSEKFIPQIRSFMVLFFPPLLKRVMKKKNKEVNNGSSISAYTPQLRRRELQSASGRAVRSPRVRMRSDL